jgi:hypothetical protein
MDTNTKGDTMQTIAATNVEKVREYVRAHRNREDYNGREAVLASKPMSKIAEELGMQPGAVREAMRACGWFQAMADADRADSNAPPPARQASDRGKRHGPPRPKVPDPYGWGEE